VSWSWRPSLEDDEDDEDDDDDDDDDDDQQHHVSGFSGPHGLQQAYDEKPSFPLTSDSAGHRP
jgi:hypothetical protein